MTSDDQIALWRFGRALGWIVRATQRAYQRSVRGGWSARTRQPCRWCGDEPKPPRRTFCSNECVHEHKVRSNPGYARTCCWKRDHGVCAICRADTEAWERAREAERERLRDIESDLYDARHRGEPVQHVIAWLAERRALVNERWRQLGLPHGHRWEMDHIVPVVEGGGDCGLENLRTLCLACHRRVTAELAARRARQRRRQGELPLFEETSTC